MVRKSSRTALFLAVPLALLLAGCPESSDDDTAAGDTVDPEPLGPITLVAESTELDTGSTDTTTITTTVRDENNVVVVDEPVDFRVAAGDDAILSGPIEDRTTDESGRAEIRVAPGPNPQNRTARIIADTSQGANAIDLNISGTSIEIDGPGSLAVGQDVEYEVRLTDGAGNPVGNEPVDVDITQGVNVREPFGDRTDGDGVVRGRLEAIASSAISAFITANATDLDVSTTRNVRLPAESLSFTSPSADSLHSVASNRTVEVTWEEQGQPVSGREVEFTVNLGEVDPRTVTTGGDGTASTTIRSDIAGPVRVEATGTAASGEALQTERTFQYVGTVARQIELIASPTVIAPNEETTLRARVTDSGDNPVAGEIVEFRKIRDDTNQTQLSSNTAETGPDGVASVRLEAGAGDSGPEGVQIEAAAESDADVVATEPLTISGDAFSISLGTGNELETPDITSYNEPWKVFVTDSTGSAVPNQQVEITVTPIAYRKGRWFPTDDGWAIGGSGATTLLLEETEEVYAEIPEGDSIFDFVENDDDIDFGDIIIQPPQPSVCISSAISRGDSIFPAVPENLLEGAVEHPDAQRPTDPAVQPGTVTTDEDGEADFDLSYPRSEAPWVIVRLEAAVQFDGFTQRKRSRAFVLRILADDVDDTDVTPPGGIEGAYGVGPDCGI